MCRTGSSDINEACEERINTSVSDSHAVEGRCTLYGPRALTAMQVTGSHILNLARDGGG